MQHYSTMLLIIVASSIFQTSSSCHGFQSLLPPSQKRRLSPPPPPLTPYHHRTNTRGGAFVNGDLTSHYSSSSSYDDDDDIIESDSSGSESYDSYDSYEYDDEVDTVDAQVITGGTYERAASTAKPMSNFAMDETMLAQIGKSYFMTSLLWLSVMMDIVTNSKKRSLIFPAGAISGTNGVATAGLASGFALSSIISYLLSVELNRGATTTPTPNETLIRRKQENEEYVFIMNERVRKKMHLYLFLFGLCNLGAHLNSSKAQFLGMSGFIINVHNALIAFNSWKKDTLAEGQTIKKELMDIGHLFVKSLFFWRGRKGDGNGNGANNDDSASNKNGKEVHIHSEKHTKAKVVWLSNIFSIASIIAILRAVTIVVSSLVPYYYLGSISTAPIEKMQLIGLSWAKVARAILCGGICLSLRDEIQDETNFRRWGYKNGGVATIAFLGMSL